MLMSAQRKEKRNVAMPPTAKTLQEAISAKVASSVPNLLIARGTPPLPHSLPRVVSSGLPGPGGGGV